jgi:hypothetical protein
MSTVQTRGEIMAEYARTITGRLAAADEGLRLAVVAGDTEALLVGMGEREASLAATEDLVGELDLSGLSAAEHAAIIRLMVQSLERSQVAQAALEAELFEARRNAARQLAAPMPRFRAGERAGYALPHHRASLRTTG